MHIYLICETKYYKLLVYHDWQLFNGKVKTTNIQVRSARLMRRNNHIKSYFIICPDQVISELDVCKINYTCIYYN